MTDDLSVVPKNPEPEVRLKLDVSMWNYKDFLKFSREATKGGMRGFALAQEIIVEWDYDIPLTDANALAKLPMMEGAKVLRTINNTIIQAFEDLSIADVRVNFNQPDWTLMEMETFLAAIRNFDYDTIERIVHKVATMEGVQKGKTLPLAEGAAMVKAIRKKYEDVMQGKF